MAISFNHIPSNVKVPGTYVEFDNSQAMQGATLMNYTALVCGQKLATGTGAALTPYLVTNAAQAKELFGPGSMAARMAEAFLENNAYTELRVMAIDDDPSGTAATGTITLSGEVTAAAPIMLYIGGKAVSCGTTVGDTAATVSARLASEINTDTDLPVTAAAEAEVVTLTAKHYGILGNDIDLRLNYYDETAPQGLGIAIEAMASGAGAPDLTDLISAWGDSWYHIIAWPWTDRASLRVLETELDDRWGPMRHIDGMAFCSVPGTVAELQTFGSGSDDGNYEHVSIVECCQSPDLPWVRAAAVAGVTAYYGNIDPARPFQTLTLTGCLAPARAVRPTFAEQNLLLQAGIATTAVDAGGTVSVQRLVTNYLKTSTGAPDASYQDVNTLLTLSYLRYDFRARIARKYPRHKLAGDTETIPAGQAIMTPSIGRAEAVAAFMDWQELGLVENIDAFKAGLVCERNATDVNRLDWLMQPNLINQFRIAAAQIQFIL